MNKAKSLRFPLQSDPLPLRSFEILRRMVAQAEILFWRSFIQLATLVKRQRPDVDEMGTYACAPEKTFSPKWFFLFSVAGYLLGVLFGFLSAYLF